MAETRSSTLHVATYFRKETTRARSHSIVEIKDQSGESKRYLRDYRKTIGSGAYGDVYRFELENDPSKRILVKKEKPFSGSFSEGHHMLEEAKNWVQVKRFGAFIGDPNSSKEPHMLVMPDLSSQSSMPLKAVRYDTANEFLKMMYFILEQLNIFHEENNLIHCDITVNNILFDETNQIIDFVDLGFARTVGKRVHPTLYHSETHLKHPSYFPPELNPTVKNSLDNGLAKPGYDIYMAGRMLTKLKDDYAYNREGQKLEFLPIVLDEFNKIADAMQAPVMSRIELNVAIKRMGKLATLNPLLENQAFLNEPTEQMQLSISILKELFAESADEAFETAQLFNEQYQSLFLAHFDLEPKKTSGFHK